MPGNNKAAVNERRQKIFALLTRGMKGYEIAKELKTTEATVSRDIQYLVSQSQNYLNDLAKQTIPFMYQSSIEGIRNVLKECWAIYNADTTIEGSPNASITWNHKLVALKLAKECQEGMFKILYEGPSVIYVNSLHMKLEDLRKGRPANYSEQQLLQEQQQIREIKYIPGIEYDNALSGKG
jgi:IS30 family transposase